jgi:predicted acyl esterase
MDAIVATGTAEWNGNPKIYQTKDFNRQNLAVWATQPLTADSQTARRIRGVPTLNLTVRSTAASTTLVAYLFDVINDGTAQLITHEPYTLSELTPDKDVTVSWTLQAAGYDLPADHQLALVINSKDPLYSDASVTGSTTTISSIDGNLSYLDLPLC